MINRMGHMGKSPLSVGGARGVGVGGYEGALRCLLAQSNTVAGDLAPLMPVNAQDG